MNIDTKNEHKKYITIKQNEAIKTISGLLECLKSDMTIEYQTGA